MRWSRRPVAGLPIILAVFFTLIPASEVSADVTFEQVSLPSATGKPFTSVTIGPDGKLYAATLTGEIVRFPLNPNGTTGAAEVITSLQIANGGTQRMVIGLIFDPGATADNLVLWVTHSHYAFDGGPDWTGKLTRMSGPSLATVQDYVVGLPRSTRDHLTNSIAFGPDGALYVLQGSNTGVGAPEAIWGMRPERKLTAAVLRVDLGAISSPPLDVKTEEGGTYDPLMPLAPVRIYASGLRNAYDLLWHSNGQLYVPTNGSNPGGNTPATPNPLPASCLTRIDSGTNGPYTGPQVPGLTNVTQVQNDYLFRVIQNGYYGHPNPERCEWVLNGGNPTSGSDAAEVSAYPVGTQPDRNWRGSAFNFGLQRSANGVIEYKKDTFGGALQGKLLVVRYAQGDDIIVLSPGPPNADIVSSQTGIAGFTGFTDPLDLVENPSNGYIYVTEHGAQRIRLLRPSDGYARPQAATPTSVRLVPAFNECTSASSVHGAPLESPSCNPPVQTSGQLTIGTPDANGKVAKFMGSVVLKVVGESPIDFTNGDQADVQITTSISDVRKQSDLSDYEGQLEAVLHLRITDRRNGAGADQPGTVSDLPFSFTIACAPTPAYESIGSACNASTSADSVMSGVAREGQRAIWELGPIEVFDGGPDGFAATPDNTLFAVQGLFAP